MGRRPRYIGVLALLSGLVLLAWVFRGEHVADNLSGVVPVPVTGAPGSEAASSEAGVYKSIQRIRDARSAVISPESSLAREVRDEFYRYKRIQLSDPGRARALLNSVLDKDPYFSPALADQADGWLAENKLDAAREAAIRCLAVDEKNAVCHRTLVSTFTRQGDLEGAQTYLRDCLALDPQNPHCLVAMAQFHLRKRDLNEAKHFLDRLLAVDPRSVWSHLARAEFAEAAGDAVAAKESYLAACKLGQAYACGRTKSF